MNPIKLSLRYPIVTLILTTMLVFAGVQAFLGMPRTEDPTITIRTGLVMALYPGATSEQVEKQVTKTLEKHIFKFAEVRKEKTFSTSRPGLVVINVELEDSVTDSDQFWAKLRHEMNETRQTELPEGVKGPVVNSDFGETVALLIAVHGKQYGYRELRDYVDLIQDELRTVRNVGKLATYGGQSEQVWITSSLERVSQYLADPERIVQALRQRNVIAGSGNFEAEHAKIPMQTTGFFTTEEQIKNVLVDVSRTGQPLYIRDFAEVERRYQDPTFLVRYDGEPSILISVEMQKGKNIVHLGEQLDQVFARLKNRLPPDVQLDLIADQPHVVKERITGLSHEFMLAIGSVILVTIILLPFRVALIAALAIPVTLCVTLGVMNAVGIALHQVSIAALIVVLGIVVDDAIVIADNYVDLLDRGVPRAEAAWRSATDVLVPVFTATITIIASFLPLAILEGTSGEFIIALPITVAIALAVSFVVATVLTPILCRFFIKEGLHSHENGDAEKKKGFNLLDRLQAGYNFLIVYFMDRKKSAVVLGVAAFVAGIALFGTLREQFFPSAERNQFVIDLWIVQGSRIESTDAVMRRIEKHLAAKTGVTHYATFVGQSAPRVYYNVNPQQPDAAYGQFVVNTASVEATSRLVGELRESLRKLAPEALVIVKELQQGSQTEAPIEIRVSGDDIGELKRLGSRIEEIVSAVPYAQFVHQDYYNDIAMVDVNVNNELANRLGITEESVSRMLYGAFDGGPVSTFWEGDRPVSIMLRLDRESRSSFSDVQDAYVNSQLTNARVPLRAIATLEPNWQPSRIVRRNGVRTLTVRSFVKPGWYASDLLKTVEPQIKNLTLPAGYRIEYGGEKFNRDETFPQMLVALGISLLAIFLVLLIQFRTLSEPLVVMSSIPLALPGAVLGLLITRNPFGFTAFMGLISLSGIVVRNAIILIEYVNEKMAEGVPLEKAATEAGERRLRPIFLTTMAAAVGVTPMILSGSSLWSPLASVIAVGLVVSMFFTLLVIPVLYVIVKSRTAKQGAGVAAVAAFCLVVMVAGHALAGQVNLSLPEAVELARKQNTSLKISRAKVLEARQRIVSAKANYYPHLTNDTQYFGLSDPQLIDIPAGSLGNVPGVGPFPSQSTTIDQGEDTLLFSTTTLRQPLTQLFKIREIDKMAEADYFIAESDTLTSEHEIIFSVHQLYYSLLIAQKQTVAAQAAAAAAQEGLRESEEAVKAGNVLDVSVTGYRVQLLQNRQSLLAAENQISDLTLELNHLLGLPLDTELVLAEISDSCAAPQTPSQDLIREALSRNPELRSARGFVTKAGHAVNAAEDEYIPEISLFANYSYQDGVPFLTHTNATFGAQMTWSIFDWGSRRGVVGQRKAQLIQAEENQKQVAERITVDVTKAYRKLERTRMMIDAAREALKLNRENQRLSADRLKAATTTNAQYAESVAAVRKAELDELQATLEYCLNKADLDRVSGAFTDE
ncbi:MAG: efflux RND transporter permease subunit [Candidatus Manganitrophus sp.]|nr:MAG: efflux RND transporter permease subunit [Candidatus Manganitrophus sp.]WDT82044.1 MAG: efflux RND transporter permease subunit [Candidatus Manganitrophus sp.]